MISTLFNMAIFLGLMIFACFSWRKFETGVYAVVFCLPLYLVRANIFGIPSTALELGIYILFITWIAKRYRQINLYEIIPDKALRAGIILLLAGAVISAIFSIDIRTSAGILKGWFFDPFLFFIILASEIKTLKQKENILKALFSSGLAVAFISLIYLFFPGLNGVSYDGRLHGFYLSPNYLAMYLSPALIIGIWFVYKKFGESSWRGNKSNIKLLLGIFDLVLIGLMIYFTYSYAAWVALAVSSFSMIWLLSKGISRKNKIILLSVFSLLFFIIFFSQIETNKFENLKNLAYRSSYNSRLMIWRSALEIGKDNFLIGIGPGNFQKYYLDYQNRFSELYLEWAVPQPHNIFLAFWLETGILGLLGFILILAWFFKRSLSLLKNNLLDREYFLLSAVLLSLMIYTLIHGLFDATYWKNDLAIIFWLNLALPASIKK